MKGYGFMKKLQPVVGSYGNQECYSFEKYAIQYDSNSCRLIKELETINPSMNIEDTNRKNEGWDPL